MTARLPPNALLWPLLMGICGAVGLLAAIAPLLALGAAAAIAFVALAIADLTLGVALFTFISFLEVLPGVGELSAAKLAGGVLVLSWVAASATGSRRQLGHAHPAVVAVLGVLLGWVLLGLLWADSGSAVLGSFARYAPNALLFGIVYAAVGDRRDIRVILIAFVLGVLVSVAYGAFISPGDPDAAAEGRVSGAGVDPNELAASLVAGLALCAGAMLTRGYSVVVRAGSMVAITMLFVALVVTASRTGIIALIGAGVAAILVAGPRRRLPAVILVVVALGAGTAYVAQAAPDLARERLSSFEGGGSGRTDIWKVAVRVIKAQPVRGVGADNFPVVSVHYLLEPGTLLRDDFILDTPKVAHNVYLGIWADLGLVGLLLWLTLVAFSLRCGWRAARAFHDAGDRPLEFLARSVMVATAGMLAAAALISIEYDKSLWLMLALGPALLKLAQQPLARV